LTQGKSAVVDDDAFEELSKFNWFAVKATRKCRTIWYAARNKSVGIGRRRMVQMHREILSVTSATTKVDHKNGDGLDNQRQNLRAATSGQNLQNQHKQIGCTSRFKGVTWRKDLGKWQAYIHFQRSRHHLGYFVDEQRAAAAYDQAALRLFGEFAKPNVIRVWPTIG